MSREKGFTGIHVIILIFTIIAISMMGVTLLICKHRERKRREWALRRGRSGDLEGRRGGSGSGGGGSGGGGGGGGISRGGGGRGSQNGSGEAAGSGGGKAAEEEEGGG